MEWCACLNVIANYVAEEKHFGSGFGVFNDHCVHGVLNYYPSCDLLHYCFHYTRLPPRLSFDFLELNSYLSTHHVPLLAVKHMPFFPYVIALLQL